MIILFIIITTVTAKAKDEIKNKDLLPESNQNTTKDNTRRENIDFASIWNEYIKKKLADTEVSKKKNNEKTVPEYEYVVPGRGYVDEKMAEISARQGTNEQQPSHKYNPQSLMWNEYVGKKLAEEEIGFRIQNKDKSEKELNSDLGKTKQEQYGLKYLNDKGFLEYVRQKLEQRETQLKTNNQNGSEKDIEQKSMTQKQKDLNDEHNFINFVRQKLAESKAQIKTDNQGGDNKPDNQEETTKKLNDAFNINDYVLKKIEKEEGEFKQMQQG